MKRIGSVLVLCVVVCLLAVVSVPCGVVGLVFFIVLGPFRYFVDRAHDQEVAQLDADGYDPGCCTSEEFSAYANVNGAILSFFMELPLIPIILLAEKTQEAWQSTLAAWRRA